MDEYDEIPMPQWPDYDEEIWPMSHPKDKTWTTDELQEDFEVIGFQAPFVVVRRKSDGVLGSLQFTQSPRVYFGWVEDK